MTVKAQGRQSQVMDDECRGRLQVELGCVFAFWRARRKRVVVAAGGPLW